MNLVFFSGPQGYFFVDTVEDGEKLLNMVKKSGADTSEWTATDVELVASKGKVEPFVLGNREIKCEP